jgi:hypothetical protein
MKYNVALPANCEQTTNRYPVLYLLHGLTSDYTVGLSANEQLRQALHDYFARATTTTMARYHEPADDVPKGRVAAYSSTLAGGLCGPALPSPHPLNKDRMRFYSKRTVQSYIVNFRGVFSG